MSTRGALPGHVALLELPTFRDDRGSLSVLEGAPWIVAGWPRFFVISEVPAGATRGHHAHAACSLVLFALTGAVSVSVDDGTRVQEFRLDRRGVALYLPPLTWHILHSFAADTVCGVLASTPYDPADYIEDHKAFIEACNHARPTP